MLSDRGPLTASQSEAIIRDLEARSGKSDMLEHHLAFEQTISGSPPVLVNIVTLLENGAATYRAMFAAIEGATHTSISRPTSSTAIRLEISSRTR
jgi:cardiolipin synthase